VLIKSVAAVTFLYYEVELKEENITLRGTIELGNGTVEIQLRNRNDSEDGCLLGCSGVVGGWIWF
jgi:hypothetical protein